MPKMIDQREWYDCAEGHEVAHKATETGLISIRAVLEVGATALNELVRLSGSCVAVLREADRNRSVVGTASLDISQARDWSIL